MDRKTNKGLLFESITSYQNYIPDVLSITPTELPSEENIVNRNRTQKTQQE